MKVKTSVTISAPLLRAVDDRLGPHQSRSAFLETAIQAFIAGLLRSEQDARDLEILNRRAEALNAEAVDVLRYQVDL